MAPSSPSRARQLPRQRAICESLRKMNGNAGSLVSHGSSAAAASNKPRHSRSLAATDHASASVACSQAVSSGGPRSLMRSVAAWISSTAGSALPTSRSKTACSAIACASKAGDSASRAASFADFVVRPCLADRADVQCLPAREGSGIGDHAGQVLAQGRSKAVSPQRVDRG